MNVRKDLTSRLTRVSAASALRGGLDPSLRTKAPPAEEALIVDERCQVRPAQQVEDKLFSMLKSMFVPVSQVRLRALCKERGLRGYE